MYNNNTQEETTVYQRQLNWWKLAALVRRTSRLPAAGSIPEQVINLCVFGKNTKRLIFIGPKQTTHYDGPV